jgi:hypothetical protein
MRRNKSWRRDLGSSGEIETRRFGERSVRRVGHCTGVPPPRGST